MKKALLVIDLQNDYFPKGKFPLWNTDVVLRNIEQAIEKANAHGVPVIHIQHVAKGVAPFFNEGTPGADIHPRILVAAPTAPIVVKEFAFTAVRLASYPTVAASMPPHAARGDRPPAGRTPRSSGFGPTCGLMCLSFVFVFMVVVRGPALRSHDHDLRLVDALQPAQLGSQFLDVGCRAAQRDQLHAQVVGQVDVHARHDPVGVGVLDLDHLVRQPRPVVVVHQRQAGCHVRGVRRHRSRGESLPQQLPDRFAPRCELPVLAELIKSF